DDPVTNNAGHTVAQNTGRQQMQDGLLPFNNKCVPGIVATLKAGNHGSLLSQQVNDLALAFIAPLRSQHNNTSTHLHSSLLENLLKISGIAAGISPHATLTVSFLQRLYLPARCRLLDSAAT